MLDDHCFAVVMAGGAGSRLWPLSTSTVPKHFLPLFDGKSLIELTVEKLDGHLPSERILILTSVRYAALAQQVLPYIPPDNFVFEPCLRDTASAIGLGATVLNKRCPAATMLVLTADQIIEPNESFVAALTAAAKFLEQHPDRLVAFGIEAAAASTLVGWQRLGATIDFDLRTVRAIDAFTEKPTADVARRYLDDGGYCWNSGQFAWKARAILAELNRHLPAAGPLLDEIGQAWDTESRQMVLDRLYPQMPAGSIDYKIMQKTDRAVSILLPCRWEDMGTHAALARRIGTRQNASLVWGRAAVDGQRDHVLNNTGQTVVLAADDLNVVVTDKVILVARQDTDMKALVDRVRQQYPHII